MPPKRKSGQTDGSVDDVQPRRSTRQRTSTTAARGAAAVEPATPKTAKKKPATAKKAAPKAKSKAKQQEDDAEDAQPAPAGDEKGKPNGVKGKATPAKSTATKAESKDVKDQGRQYWLMKAEPESRIENGVDVKFSIDDLAAKSEPEPWDGMLPASHS